MINRIFSLSFSGQLNICSTTHLVRDFFVLRFFGYCHPRIYLSILTAYVCPTKLNIYCKNLSFKSQRLDKLSLPFFPVFKQNGRFLYFVT